jgi:hypothetical protein
MTSITDAIIAVLTTVGIAVAVSLAFVLAGAFFKRSTARHGQPTVSIPAQHPTQTDDTRELVLR